MQWLWLQVFVDKPINKFFLKVTVIIYSRISFFIISVQAIISASRASSRSSSTDSTTAEGSASSELDCGFTSVECATGAEGVVSGSSTTDAALESDSAAVPATGLAIGTATLEAVETTVLSFSWHVSSRGDDKK